MLTAGSTNALLTVVVPIAQGRMKLPGSFSLGVVKNVVDWIRRSVSSGQKLSFKIGERSSHPEVTTSSSHNQSDHFLFIKSTNDIFVALLVYVDDIVITGNDTDALKVLRYLKGSPGKGLRYSSNNHSDPLSGKVVGFSDANWAKFLVTRKSVSVTLPVPLYCDNKSAIQIANNPVFHERTKHFEVDVHFIREKIAKGSVRTHKIESSNQIADIFTKHLPVAQHKFLSSALLNKGKVEAMVKRACSALIGITVQRVVAPNELLNVEMLSGNCVNKIQFKPEFLIFDKMKGVWELLEGLISYSQKYIVDEPDVEAVYAPLPMRITNDGLHAHQKNSGKQKRMLAKILRNDICNAYEKLDDVVIDETEQCLMAEKA
ncbi:hypothetical protein Tco_0627385 [Tanacetum coccineum]|uniref:Uncharacterized protein n=1 Tax=Tanacetum coccineum TaxID=301880 RepID=A0ABQ4WMI0_9ASTR